MEYGWKLVTLETWPVTEFINKSYTLCTTSTWRWREHSIRAHDRFIMEGGRQWLNRLSKTTENGERRSARHTAEPHTHLLAALSKYFLFSKIKWDLQLLKTVFHTDAAICNLNFYKTARSIYIYKHTDTGTPI